MRDGVDEAAVDQRQHGRAEDRVGRQAVRAVGVLVQRRRAVEPGAAAVEQRHRHPRAVARGREAELGRVVRAVEAAQHRFALELLALAGAHVVVVGGARRGGRGVDVAQQRGRGLVVRAELHGVGRVGGVEQEVAPVLPAVHPQLGEAARALAHREVVVEGVEVLHEGVGAVRDDVLPGLAVGHLVDRHLDDAEVARLPVGAQHEAVADVRQLVLVVALAGHGHLEGERRIADGGVARLARDGALQGDVDEPVGLRARDPHVEAVVLLLVDERVILGVGAAAVPVDLVAEQRLRILADVEQRGVVVGPGERGLGVVDDRGQPGAGLHVADADGVLAAADGVLRDGGPAAVGAHLEVGDGIELMPLGALVAVEDDLLGRIQAAALAGEDGVFLARLVARVVPVAVPALRHGRIVLLDAADDLAVELVLERAVRRHHLAEMGVLGLEVGEHVLVGALVVAQPVPGVGPRAERRGHHEGPLLGERRRRRRRRRRHRGAHGCRRGQQRGEQRDDAAGGRTATRMTGRAMFVAHGFTQPPRPRSPYSARSARNFLRRRSSAW